MLLRALSLHSEREIIVIALRLSSYCYAKYCGLTVVGLWQVPFLASLFFWKKLVSSFSIDTRFYAGLAIKKRYFESAYTMYCQTLRRRLVNHIDIVFLTGTSRLSEQAIRSHFSKNRVIYWEAGMHGTIYMSEKGVNADADFRDIVGGQSQSSYFAKLFNETCSATGSEEIYRNTAAELLFKTIDGLYLIVLRYLLLNKEVDEILPTYSKPLKTRRKILDSNIIPEYCLFVDQVEQDTNFTHFGNSPSDTLDQLKTVMESEYLSRSTILVRRAHPRQLVTQISQKLRHRFKTKYIDDSGSDLTESLLNAKLIITVNSTVGVEALLLGRPVVLLGESYFDRLYGVLSPEDGLRFVSGQLDLDFAKIKTGISEFLNNCFIPIDYRRDQFIGIHGFDDFLKKLER